MIHDDLNMPFALVVSRMREGLTVICDHNVYERARRVIDADEAIRKAAAKVSEQLTRTR